MQRSAIADLPLHGGPVPQWLADRMSQLGSAIAEALIENYGASKLGDRDKLDGFRRLEQFARAVESQLEPKADFDAVIRHEQAISPSLDGRSVFDRRPKQLSLF